MKSYTSLEQSKKLAEILPFESADMFYNLGESQLPDVIYGDYDDFKCYLPCWSLAALRNILPVGIKINENTYLFGSHNTLDKCWVYRYYNEDDTSYLYCKNTNEVDACCEMIIKLHELKML